MFKIREIKQQAHILDVWAALGGGKIQHNRARAFWRNGDGFSVALDRKRDLWHDFVSGEGGDVVSLVRTVEQCSFLQAADWLAKHTGVSVSEWVRRDDESGCDSDWPTDLKWASWWGMAAEVLAEEALAELPPWHPDQRGLTSLLNTIKLGDASLVAEYRRWRQRSPMMTAGLAQAGRLHDARVQRRLARWMRKMYGQPTT